VAARNRSGERHERDARITDHFRHLRVIEAQELKYPGGQAGGFERLRVALRDERSLRRHLEDHAVAGEERGNHRVDGREPRIIPGRDHEDDP
jgi:hypothetical protein